MSFPIHPVKRWIWRIWNFSIYLSYQSTLRCNDFSYFLYSPSWNWAINYFYLFFIFFYILHKILSFLLWNGHFHLNFRLNVLATTSLLSWPDEKILVNCAERQCVQYLLIRFPPLMVYNHSKKPSHCMSCVNAQKSLDKARTLELEQNCQLLHYTVFCTWVILTLMLTHNAF